MTFDSTFLVVAPVAIPLITATLCLFTARRLRLQQLISTIGSLILFGASLVLLLGVAGGEIWTAHLSNWHAPIGIVLVADRLAASMVLLTGICAATIGFFSLSQVAARDQASGFHSLFHFLMAGVCGAFLTGDLFNLFVWFEVMLLSSFVLLGLGGGKKRIQGAVKYVTLNLIGSAIFLVSIGVLYGQLGTLNMADVAAKLADESAEIHGSAIVAVVGLLVAFALKAGVFPLFFWLPASYHAPSPATSAIFAGLLTKVGVYALIRTCTLILPPDAEVVLTVLAWIGVATMFIGVMGAAVQIEFRKVLSFHIISQIGYMVLGLAIYTPLAIGAAVYFMAHNIIAKSNLFLVAGLARRIAGTEDLKALGGLANAKYWWGPWIMIAFFIPAMSLAGLPPLSGFFAKLGILMGGLEVVEQGGTPSLDPVSAAIAVGVALLVGLFTLFSMIKIWNEAFWKPAKQRADGVAIGVDRPTPVALDPRPVPVRFSWFVPSLVMAGITVVMGLFAGPILAWYEAMATELLTPELYRAAVLQGVEP